MTDHRRWTRFFAGQSAWPRLAGCAPRTRVAAIVILANVVGLLTFLQARAPKLLAAVVDPLHPDWMGMEQAFGGFALYATGLLGIALVALFAVAAAVRRRWPGSGERRSTVLPAMALAGGLTGIVVLVFIEVLLFQDYGIHLYEFDVFGILADSALRRDLGIQPAEVARVTVAAVTLLAAELLLFVAAAPLARWRNGALARASTLAMAAAVPGGLFMFRSAESSIESDRAEFEGALPLGRQLLLRARSRPFIPVAPRLGSEGYPVVDSASAAPALERKPNIVFFVADGLRADMFNAELTPNLWRFAEGRGVIGSQRHFSTGHVSEAGIFGLLYGVHGHAFHSFVEERVPPFPLEVLKRSGYHTFLLSSSRLSPYPTDQLMRAFDQVAYPANDDAAVEALREYVAARRADGRPYFVLAFFYTPHYPFTSAKPQFRRFPLVGPKARSNYMNDVLQADDYFRQTLELVDDDYREGRAIVLATSDHGEEIRDHGVFGHASATFWNEKVLVPFALGLDGHSESQARRPALTSHVDVWPTIFDHLGILSALPAFSDGRSLRSGAASPPPVLVTGRFFPYADRPSVLVDSSAKYWFRVEELGANDRLCVVVTRITTLEDEPLDVASARLDADMVPAFEHLQRSFWRFLRPTAPSNQRGRRIC